MRRHSQRPGTRNMGQRGLMYQTISCLSANPVGLTGFFASPKVAGLSCLFKDAKVYKGNLSRKRFIQTLEHIETGVTWHKQGKSNRRGITKSDGNYPIGQQKNRCVFDSPFESSPCIFCLETGWVGEVSLGLILKAFGYSTEDQKWAWRERNRRQEKGIARRQKVSVYSCCWILFPRVNTALWETQYMYLVW